MLKIGNIQVDKTAFKPRVSLSVVVTLFNRTWWWVTLVVLLGIAVLVRLGIWQLDRLEQRKARNTALVQQLALPPLLLTAEALPDDVSSLKYRRVSASGEFDYTHQVALLHQNWMDAPGIHLITPLVLEGGSQAVLVDRGWLPTDQASSENWTQYNETGSANRHMDVVGFVKLSQLPPANAASNTHRIPAEPQSEWYRVDIEAMQAQMPYELLPIYILQSPPESDTNVLPYQVQPELDLSNGSHLSYAIQWFTFALILGVIYVRYVGSREKASQDSENGKTDES